MENIEEKIKDLNLLLSCIKRHFDFLSSKTRRVVILSFLSDVRSVVLKLNDIEKELDTNLSTEVSTIDFNKWLNEDYWKIDMHMYDAIYYECEDNQTVINYMIDYFTNNKPNAISVEKIGDLKSGLNVIWNNENLTGKQVVNALTEGILSLKKQLKSVYKKVRNADGALYAKFYQDIIEKYKEGKGMEFFELQLKITAHDIEYDKLDEKRTKYLYDFLKKEFLSYTENPSKRDIAKCKIVVNDMHLDAKAIVDDRIKEYAARFEQFIIIDEGGKIIPKEEELGKYLFTNQKRVNNKDLATFISVLEMIQQEMDYQKQNTNIKTQQAAAEEEAVKAARAFIAPLEYMVIKDKREQYKEIWINIFENHKKELQDKGKQKNVKFNKKLVSNIIGVFKKNNYYVSNNDTELAKILGETKESTCRQYISQGNLDWDEKIKKEFNALLSA